MIPRSGGSCAGPRALFLAGSLSILRVGLAFDSGLVVLRLVELGSFRAGLLFPWG